MNEIAGVQGLHPAEARKSEDTAAFSIWRHWLKRLGMGLALALLTAVSSAYGYRYRYCHRY